jgi:hypothetical protein
MTEDSVSLNNLSLVIAVKCSGVTLSTRVALYSTVENIRNKIRVKLPGNTENFRLYLGNLPLDATRKLSDYPAFIGAVGGNKNFEVIIGNKKKINLKTDFDFGV